MKRMYETALGRVTYVFIGLAAVAVMSGCDRDGEEMNVNGLNSDLLVLSAAKTTVAPTLDGTVGLGEWDEAEAIYVSTEVPDIESFPGYAGRGYQVRLKAMYDDQNVYFLVQYDDPGLNLDRQTWYFDPDDQEWRQESGRPLFDDSGVQTRQAFYEDKFSFMFQANQVDGFDSNGCWVACHTGLAPTSNDGGKTDLKYTNDGGQVLDMWHWKSVRGTAMETCDDQYTDSQRSAQNGGRHSDAGTNAYVNNVTTINGFNVPKFLIPNPSVPYYWVVTDGSDPVPQAEGTALAVVDVADDGSLTLSDATVIDPNVDGGFGRDESKRPPSIYVRPPSGDRADINAVAMFSKGWTVEFKRSLVTGSSVDVQFGDLGAAYPFGVAVFDNAQIAHAVSDLPVLLTFRR